MLLSFAWILVFGLLLGKIFEKFHLPGLAGMILAGIVLGPYVLNGIDESVLNISTELRRIALIIILMRAGLTLNLDDLKKVGRPAILMCFVPACFEMLGYAFVAPILLHISLLDALLMGAVISAVSPAVVVPKMLKLIHEGYGKEHAIPQLILAGSSVDDVFVIVVFSMFLSFEKGSSFSYQSFLNIPISIVLGMVVGYILGIIFSKLIEKVNFDHVINCILFLSLSFLLVSFEDAFSNWIPFASYIAIMAMGVGMQKECFNMSVQMSETYANLWKVAQVFLFVLLGSAIDIHAALSGGIQTIALIFIALLFRMVGVAICLFKTKLTKNERLFCCVAYTPKATVQAAIGSIPLAEGVACGNIVLITAAISILLTAPLGAFVIDCTYKKLLKKM